MELNAIVENLKCPLCKCVFMIPKLLPCGHTMCEHCLKYHICHSVPMLGSGILDNENDSTSYKPEKETFTCPVEACEAEMSPRKSYEHVRLWSRGFPNNLGVVSAIDLCRGHQNGKGVHCDPCRKLSINAEATSICLSCYEKYCLTCDTIHRTTLIDHKILSISTVRGCLSDKNTGHRSAVEGVVGPARETKHCKVHMFCEVTKLCQSCAEECCERCLETKHHGCANDVPLTTTIDEAKQTE